MCGIALIVGRGADRAQFAFAITDRLTGGTYLARDPVGVKPLYWSCRRGRLHVASEVKALVPVGAPVSEVLPGHHGWAAALADPELTPYVDPIRLGDDRPQIDDAAEAAKVLRWPSRTASGSESTPT